MKIQGINFSITSDQWFQVLDEAFELKPTLYQGHAYVYLNSNGECNPFSSSTRAKDQKFHWKLTIDDIITISRTSFKDYAQYEANEIAALRNAFEIMDKGSQQSWWSRLVHWLRGLGFHSTHELIDEQLQLIMDRQIQVQYKQLRDTLEEYKQTIPKLGLIDERFVLAYTALLQDAQSWVETFEQTSPQTYEDWIKQEEALTNIHEEVRQTLNFNQRILSIVESKESLTQFLEEDPSPPIQQEEIDEINTSLKELINQMFDQLALHDEEVFQQKFDELDTKLEELQNQAIDENKQVEETVTPKAVTPILQDHIQVLRGSPLREIPASLRKRLAKKEAASETTE